MYKCLHLYIKENRWDGYVENGGGKVPQLDPGGPGGGVCVLIPACRSCVNVKSHTSRLLFFPQYLMTFFEKCTVIILVYNWDSER